MAFNDATVVVGVTPRLSKEKFTQILRERASPAASESDPAFAWSVVQENGVDPAFALAIFHQESQFAKDSGSAVVLHALRNPGHTRSSRIGVGTTVQTQWGKFIRYPSWTDGWRDAAFRLVDPQYDYAKQGRRGIRRILELWAPPDDPAAPGINNTDIYVRNVVRNMTDWVDLPAGGQPTTVIHPGCPPDPPPAFDGTDQQVGPVTFHAAAQTVTVVREGLPCHKYADPATCETRGPLARGDTFEALYWVEGKEVSGQDRWWVARSGSRIWGGGTSPRPGDDA